MGSFKLNLVAIRVSIFWIAVFLFLSPVANARVIPFYNDSTGWTPELMDVAISKAKPGDILVFDESHKFRIGKKLGEGGTTMIFDLPDFPGKAIRLPWHVSDATIPSEVPRFIDFYYEGARQIHKAGIPSVQIYDYLPSKYLIVEKIDVSTSLYTFIRHATNMPQKQRDKMTKELVDFFRSTSDFEKLGDFRSSQVVYVAERGWVLLDWTKKHVMRQDSLSNDNIFDQLLGKELELVVEMKLGSRQGVWLQDLRHQVKTAITKERFGGNLSQCRASIMQLMAAQKATQGIALQH